MEIAATDPGGTNPYQDLPGTGRSNGHVLDANHVVVDPYGAAASRWQVVAGSGISDGEPHELDSGTGGLAAFQKLRR